MANSNIEADLSRPPADLPKVHELQGDTASQNGYCRLRRDNFRKVPATSPLLFAGMIALESRQVTWGEVPGTYSEAVFWRALLPRQVRKIALLPAAWGEKNWTDIIVVERETAGPESQRVRRQVKLPSQNPCFHLGGAVTPIAVRLENHIQVRQKENIHRRVTGQLLIQSEKGSFRSELPRP